VQLHMSDGTIGVFDSTNVTFVSSLNHNNCHDNKMVSWATNHVL
jgi:hypothetical protein